MQAVVPAAGEGTRLRPLTEETPKGLLDVAGKSILTRCFERLLAADVEEVVVVVGYRKDAIVARYGDSFRGVPIRYVHQREQRGLGHAVLQAEPCVDGGFVLVNGDNVLGTDLDELLARYREDGVDAAMLVERVSRAEARTTGVVETADDGRVTAMVEKPEVPPSTLVSAGCYVLPPEVFHALHLVRPGGRGEHESSDAVGEHESSDAVGEHESSDAVGEHELSDAVDLLVAAGATVETVPLAGWRVNVNTPADLSRAERKLAGDSPGE